MTTKSEREAAAKTESTTTRRRSRAKPVETPPPNSSTSDETPPSAAPEAVAVLTSSQTCVFCNEAFQVDPANPEGGSFITEPALSIRHFVCAGCGDA